ncbi:hypothetical protein [Actinomadura sp. 6N118]|uniref:hypothetical protein n=1 Tax=Actinomadura sp. 6N118 TaxID=3375151 RepID=UPI0037A45DA5
MDHEAAGAAALLTAIDDAAHEFRTFGYARFLEHQSVTWRLLGGTGFADAPGISVGVSFGLNDADERDVSMHIVIRLRDGLFEVSGDAMIDDPGPGRLEGGNQRDLRELPEVRTADLGELIATLKSYTANLCSYDSILDEVRVPRTP